MAKFILTILTMFFSFTCLNAHIWDEIPVEASDSDGQSNEFWPCDWVPHPHPPGGGPSGPGEPEMA
jgi:hypothetical protein